MAAISAHQWRRRCRRGNESQRNGGVNNNGNQANGRSNGRNENAAYKAWRLETAWRSRVSL